MNLPETSQSPITPDKMTPTKLELSDWSSL